MRKVQIGDAVLYNGDCYEVMNDIKNELKNLDAIITDPPYGCTEIPWDKALDCNSFWKQILPVGKPNAAYCICAQMPFAIDVINSNRKMFRYDLIWRKPKPGNFINSNRMPQRGHEYVLIFYSTLPTFNPQMRKGFEPYTRINFGNTGVWCPRNTLKEVVSVSEDGSRFPITIIESDSDFSCFTNEKRHPTQKPIWLMDWLVKSYTNQHETVFDPFMGSGTTGLASIMNLRKFIGIEKDKHWFDVACKNIEKILYEYSLLRASAECLKKWNNSAISLNKNQSQTLKQHKLN